MNTIEDQQMTRQFEIIRTLPGFNEEEWNKYHYDGTGRYSDNDIDRLIYKADTTMIDENKEQLKGINVMMRELTLHYETMDLQIEIPDSIDHIGSSLEDKTVTIGFSKSYTFDAVVFVGKCLDRGLKVRFPSDSSHYKEFVDKIKEVDESIEFEFDGMNYSVYLRSKHHVNTVKINFFDIELRDDQNINNPDNYPHEGIFRHKQDQSYVMVEDGLVMPLFDETTLKKFSS